MKKTFIKLFSIFAIVALLVSCNKDDETYNYQTPTEQGDNNDNNNNNDEEDNIHQIVSQNVRVNVNYQDYAWRISGTTSLSSVLNGQEIKYKIQCGYYIDDNLSFQEYYIDNITYSIDHLAPVFQPGIGDFVELAFYWRSYLALIEEPELSQSEQDLYDYIIDLFEDYEYEAKYNYWGRFVVEIDGIDYIVKKFGLEL